VREERGDRLLADHLLEVKDLQTVFETEDGTVRAVDGVSFHIDPGETLGLVGESGCGKSVTSLSIMRLVSRPGRIAGGQILFDGQDLLKKSDSEMRAIRGNRISMIFQEPMTSLNPVYTVGDQIAEAIVLHQKKSHRAAFSLAVEMLRKVGIPSPEKRAREYPHQMSGGMRQRVMIAMALSCNPQLLIADEPTTALDVTIQAQILELIKTMQQEFGSAVLIITHDLGVVAEVADRVCVMYTGKIVEQADSHTLYARAYHPYTEGLLRSIPRLDQGRGRLHVIEGNVPNPLHLPPGCRFAPRCPYVEDKCRAAQPPLMDVGGGTMAACIIPPDQRRAREAEAS
jgi:oligopeptide/dipeptide ABC transporter ATP-binding protein